MCQRRPLEYVKRSKNERCLNEKKKMKDACMHVCMYVCMCVYNIYIDAYMEYLLLTSDGRGLHVLYVSMERDGYRYYIYTHI
jgi:hypothetical protein